MSIPNIYTSDGRVSSDLCGFDSKMSVADVMSVFQLAVSDHTDLMGIGSQTILEHHGAKWIISKIRFEFDRFLSYGEHFSVSTWPLEPGSVRFNRVFELHDSAGVSVCRAFSDWCIIGADSGRLLKTSTLENPLDEYLTDRAVVSGYSDFAQDLSEDDFCFEKTMRVSELDLNRHVNNISYIRLALDGMSSAELEKMQIKAFEIHYKRQCFEGDCLKVYKKSCGDGFFVCAKCNSQTVFESSFNK